MADEKRLRQRAEIEDRYKWNIEDMYAGFHDSVGTGMPGRL